MADNYARIKQIADRDRPPRNEPMTLEAVAHTMGITRERVRQIEATALRKLKHRLRERGTINFKDIKDD